MAADEMRECERCARNVKHGTWKGKWLPYAHARPTGEPCVKRPVDR